MGAGLYNSFNIPLCLKHFIIKREKKKRKNKHTILSARSLLLREKRDSSFKNRSLSIPPFLCVI